MRQYLHQQLYPVAREQASRLRLQPSKRGAARAPVTVAREQASRLRLQLKEGFHVDIIGHGSEGTGFSFEIATVQIIQ